jgi:hypothetical protein
MELVLVALVAEQEKRERDQHPYERGNRAGIVIRADGIQALPSRHAIPGQSEKNKK